jgi:hypothetical protein
MNHTGLRANTLRFQAIQFKFHDRINLWSISFQSVIPETAQGDKRFCHHDDPQSFAQIAISIPDRCKGLTFDPTHSQWANMYKSVRGSRLTSLTVSYTCSSMYKSIRGSRLTSLTISYTPSATYKSARGSRLTSQTISYTRSATYESSRGSRWRSLTISYTHSTTYKSAKGSRLTSLTISYTRNAAYKSSRGSRLMSQPSLIRAASRTN